MRTYVSLQNEERITHQERDDFAVQSILNQEGNGLVLRGSAHQEYIENALTEACLNSRRSL